MNTPSPAAQAELWKRKLAAFLHDPPEKAFDYGPAHQQAARKHAASFGVAELWDSLTHHPDWSAAAADRFVFPDGQKSGVGALGEEGRTVFVHPMSGRKDRSPSWDAASFPSFDTACEWIGDIRPDWKDQDPHTLFLKAWRLWMDYAASHATGAGKGAERLPFLPADTRVPDASIWHHNAVVSAMETTRPNGNPERATRPAFCLFQVGPVQEFIAQARSTRDLWSGSYLLSWLIMHAIKALADECGPDALIFPSLRGQPLYEWLERRLELSPDPQRVLTPGIPNRFLALVPLDFDPTRVKSAFDTEWQRIATACKDWIQELGAGISNAVWDEQIRSHWQITWQLWPWQSVEEALISLRNIPLGRNSPLHCAKEVVECIPGPHRDGSCYRNGRLDPGWAWSAHYQLCQHALDARRNLRDFNALAFDPRRKPANRDAFSGREEAVLEAKALKELSRHKHHGHVFRHADPLGAANSIKRVWHHAYLAKLGSLRRQDGLSDLARARESFDSVPAVAAAAWIAHLHDLVADNPDVWADLISLSETLAHARVDLRGIAVPDAIDSAKVASESKWLDRMDGEIFTERFWQTLDANTRNSPGVQAASTAVARLKKRHKLGEPPVYYAIVALDGDQIGKWLSGEKTPHVRNVIAPRAEAYFAKSLPAWYAEHAPEKQQAVTQAVAAWLDSPRPLSPSWHLQFSEALANFGLHAARRIVEEIHHGQLIYSGGDDVLAMLPADTAVVCATDLRAAFQGRRIAMSAKAQAVFAEGVPEGFLQLVNPQNGEPSWPLLMPGPRMSVSVGIAVAHVKEPLQDVVQEAQRAEKRAKANPVHSTSTGNHSSAGEESWQDAPRLNEGWGRDALAMTLFKRSGEVVRWGAQFASPALGLLEYLQQHYRAARDEPHAERPIRSRFPYRLAQLLGAYDAAKPLTPELCEIVRKELEHVISRQTATDDEARNAGSSYRREDFARHCASYLDHLVNFTWTQEGVVETRAPRCLNEFLGLFLSEAFLRRQAE
jgi:CRISPR-associated protein Cmr2